jgi:predicted lipid-binding transport protein (Tim44 family)
MQQQAGGQQKGAAVPGRQQQQQQQQQQPQQQQQQLQTQAARPSTVSQAFSDPFLNTFGGGGGALAPWGGYGGGALAPWGALGGGMLSPFGGLGVGGEIAPLMNQALGELQRVQQLALAALPGPMRVDVVETDSEYRLVADLPGVAMRDVKIDVDANNVLHISAEKANAVEQDETRVRIRCVRGERARAPS